MHVNHTHTPSPFAEYLTVAKVASILNVSPSTVARQFGSMEGVIDLGTPERMHKRRRWILRIPRRALEQFIASRQVRRR
jgi:AraC-like DNA-binding protein